MNKNKIILRRLRDKWNYLFRKKEIKFLRDKIASPTRQHVSVLSMNCFAGHLYQDFKIPYESPTAGLFFFADDFCAILKDVEILKRDIVFVPKSKWKLANDKMPFRAHPYPIGRFKGTDIEIHFLHYYTKEEALDKWKRRMARFDFNHYLAIGFQQNECTKETIERFETIDIPNKLFFTNWDLQLRHAVYISEFRGKESSPDPYKYTNIYYRYLVDFIRKNPLK